MKTNGLHTTVAFAFSCAGLALGYVLLGLLPAFLFAFGFVGGFVLWLLIPSRVRFQGIKLPYFLTLAAFVLHKIEERYWDFFPALSRITGKPMPEPNSLLALLLYAFAGAWLLIPLLVGRGHPLGYYLAWTFFTSMGVIELAHFAFPFFTPEPYGYFPGMTTVVLLAPAGWWGMVRLRQRRESDAK